MNTLFGEQYLEKSESKHCLHKNMRVFDKLSNDMQVVVLWFLWFSGY